ncbi:MAG: YiiD C-terminal domain-containing protein [Gammaproteobacteria bacterium]|nr:YiiD C-terminal domain-containing protein [Gammaproteobacteria bacterium]
MAATVMTGGKREPRTCGYCAYKLEEVFYSRIPLTQKLGARIVYYDGQRLLMQAPLAVHAVSCGSAFVGSVAAILMLCGFGLIQLKLSEIGYGADVMLGRSTLSHEGDVRNDMQAFCELAPGFGLDRFQQAYRRRKMANMHVVGGIECDSQTLVAFDGIYAVRNVCATNKGFLGSLA